MKGRRCCCGKCTVDDGDRATVINDIGHEPLGEDGAFCGPVWRQDLRDLRRRNAKLIDIVKALRPFAWPEITRGPASKKWVDTMRSAQEALEYITCPGCKGEGERMSEGGCTVCDPPPRMGLCSACYGTGLVNPEDY